MENGPQRRELGNLLLRAACHYSNHRGRTGRKRLLLLLLQPRPKEGWTGKHRHRRRDLVVIAGAREEAWEHVLVDSLRSSSKDGFKDACWRFSSRCVTRDTVVGWTCRRSGRGIGIWKRPQQSRMDLPRKCAFVRLPGRHGQRLRPGSDFY